MATAFGDFGKSTRDLLDGKKSFPAGGSFKVDTKTVTANGITIETTSLREFAQEKDPKGNKVTVEKVSTCVSPKVKVDSLNLELSAKLSTANQFQVGATASDLLTKGLKVEGTLKQEIKADDNQESTLSVSSSFKNDLFTVGGGVDFPAPSETGRPTKANANITAVPNFVSDDLTLGVGFSWESEVKKSTAVPKAKKAKFVYTGKAQLKTDKYQATATYSRGPNKDASATEGLVRLSWYQVYSDIVNTGVTFGFDHYQFASTSKAEVGAEWKNDSSTTSKGKFSVALGDKTQPEFRWGLALQQKLSSHVTATVGADLNARQLLQTGGPGNPHSFGLAMKIE